MGASEVIQKPRIYLDHAATSWPKPEMVYVAMDRYAREFGAAAGRGDYRAAAVAGEIVSRCRRSLMRLVNASSAEQIAMFSNGTSALNAAIFGVVRPGDHVVTSAIEHNSVLRPLEELRVRGTISLDIIGCDSRGLVDVEQMTDRINDKTALVALAHGSNVTGAVQDVSMVGERVLRSNALFLCDAAQTLGYLPIDVRRMNIDLLAAPGHKGACGPLGTGMLYVSNKALARLRPTCFGGTGSVSESLQMPNRMPEMLEAGNLNVPAIAGWSEGLNYLEACDPLLTKQTRLELCKQLESCLSQVDYGFATWGAELPIASIVFDRVDAGLVGSLLGSEYTIDVRCGLHCAAMIHESIRQASLARIAKSGDDFRGDYSGTLRLSAGHMSTSIEIDQAASAIDDLVRELTQ